MFGFLEIPPVSGEALYYLRSYAMLFLLGAVGVTPLVRNAAARLDGRSVGALLRPAAAIGLLLVCTAYLVDGSFNPFLYFRF